MFKFKWLMVCLTLTWCIAGCSPKEDSSLQDVGKDAARSIEDTTKDMVDATRDAVGSATDAATRAAEAAVGSVKDQLADVTKKASEALSGIEGGPEILKQVTQLFESAGETLHGIADIDSAKAALPKISELTSSLDGLTTSLGNMPAEAKTAIGGVIEKGVGTLKALAEKILAIPGVQDVIKPQLDEFMTKLAAIMGKSE
ncbi:MAG: hypothetical protein JW829_21480 [Pirellulales bacterium]|nr:hypothetical protein [Pirellulales bacterium]